MEHGTESNLYTSVREFAHWGNLHLNKGFVNGQQVVPKDNIRFAEVVEQRLRCTCKGRQNRHFRQCIFNFPLKDSEIG